MRIRRSRAVMPGRASGDPTRSRRTLRWLGFMATFPLAACYTYTATPVEGLSPGLQARVRLDEDGFGRVLNQAATNRVPPESMDLQGRGVVGRVLRVEPDTLTVELRGVGGSVFSAAVPSYAIQEVALRTFSPRRTLGVVVVGAALFAAVFTGTSGGRASDGPPPQPDLTILRLFSIQVP